MSRNQKAPLLAFVLVALVCGLILVDSLRGNAVGQISVFGPPRVELRGPVPDRAPSAPVDDAPPEAPAGGPTGLPGSLGEAMSQGGTVLDPVLDPELDPSSGEDGAGLQGQEQATASEHELGSLGSSTGGPEAGTDQAEDPGDEPPGSDPDAGSDEPDGDEGHDGPLGSGGGLLGLKDPTAGIANFGPDGGRPEIDPNELEPLTADGANITDATDSTDSTDVEDPEAPVDPADSDDPADTDDRSDQPEQLPPGAEPGHGRKGEKGDHKRGPRRDHPAHQPRNNYWS